MAWTGVYNLEIYWRLRKTLATANHYQAMSLVQKALVFVSMSILVSCILSNSLPSVSQTPIAMRRS